MEENKPAKSMGKPQVITFAVSVALANVFAVARLLWKGTSWGVILFAMALTNALAIGLFLWQWRRAHRPR